MVNFLDKEFHPVIEDFIIDYAEEKMEPVEKASFEEVLVGDDDLRELAFSAREGKKLLEQFREIKACKGFMERLMETISLEK